MRGIILIDDYTGRLDLTAFLSDVSVLPVDDVPARLYRKMQEVLSFLRRSAAIDCELTHVCGITSCKATVGVALPRIIPEGWKLCVDGRHFIVCCPDCAKNLPTVHSWSEQMREAQVQGK